MTPILRCYTHGRWCNLLSGYTKFAVIGADAISSYIVQQFLKEVIVLTRQGAGVFES
jgi:hypothetical protein